MEYNLETVGKSCEKYKRLRFPLKIWVLLNASDNRFLYWDGSESVIIVERSKLDGYLASAESIFCFEKPPTFVWLMDLNGFVLEGGDFNEDQPTLRYKHPSFTRKNRPFFEQLLRCPEQREVIDHQRDGNCSIRHIPIPHGFGDLAQSRAGTSFFAREKHDLLMEMKALERAVREAYENLAKSDDSDGLVPVIEVPDKYCDEAVVDIPQYNKERLIAGNYGRRSNVEDLKRFFGNYLPVYEEASDGPTTLLIKSPDRPKSEETKDETDVILSSSPEPDHEPVPVAQDEKPLPINTLETFDYPDNGYDDDRKHDSIREGGGNNFRSAIMDGTDSPMLGFGNETDSSMAGGNIVAALQMNEEQFQLYSDIRETFDVLNQF